MFAPTTTTKPTFSLHNDSKPQLDHRLPN